MLQINSSLALYENTEDYMFAKNPYNSYEDLSYHGKRICDLTVEIYKLIEEKSPTILEAELALENAKKVVRQNCKVV